jgi:hypothetical protein
MAAPQVVQQSGSYAANTHSHTSYMHLRAWLSHNYTYTLLLLQGQLLEECQDTVPDMPPDATGTAFHNCSSVLTGSVTCCSMSSSLKAASPPDAAAGSLTVYPASGAPAAAPSLPDPASILQQPRARLKRCTQKHIAAIRHPLDDMCQACGSYSVPSAIQTDPVQHRSSLEAIQVNPICCRCFTRSLTRQENGRIHCICPRPLMLWGPNFGEPPDSMRHSSLLSHLCILL